MSDQPEALRLADALLAMGIPADVADPAAVLLRAQHEEIERLRARAEPVAWINDELDIELSHKPWMSEAWKPLYTAPPTRPLTDEEIDELPWCPSFENPMTLAEGLRHFARAIERAHKIGGNDE